MPEENSIFVVSGKLGLEEYSVNRIKKLKEISTFEDYS